MPENLASKRPLGVAIVLIVTGVVGWFAAFWLTVEKFALLANPGSVLSCDFSVLVQCRANLDSWQGSLFGFPNPLIGIAAWIAPIVVGFALVAGARFDRWFWVAFTAGVTAGLAFVAWLIGQSMFSLGTLCPWCMVTWAAMIPLFWTVLLHALRAATFPHHHASAGWRVTGSAGSRSSCC